MLVYEISSVTGDLWNAGTEANIYITIYGDKGDTGVRQLYAPDDPDKFKKGRVGYIITLYTSPMNFEVLEYCIAISIYYLSQFCIWHCNWHAPLVNFECHHLKITSVNILCYFKGYAIGLNIFFQVESAQKKDWVGLKVQHYPLLFISWHTCRL